MNFKLLSCLLVTCSIFSLQAVIVFNKISSDKITVMLNKFGCQIPAGVTYFERPPIVLPYDCELSTEYWNKQPDIMVIICDGQSHDFINLTNKTIIVFSLDEAGKIKIDRQD